MNMLYVGNSNFTSSDFAYCSLTEMKEAVVHVTMKGDFVTFEFYGSHKTTYTVNFYRVLEGDVPTIDSLYEQLITRIFVKDEVFNALQHEGKKIAISLEWYYNGVEIADYFVSVL